MKWVVTCWFLVVLHCLVTCQVQETTQSPDSLPTSTDPYANVLSQLSDVIFDVEDRLYRLTAPRDDMGNLKSLNDRKKENHRKNYFDRIRDNYKNLQDQVGQSLSSGGVIKLADILNLDFQNKGHRSSLDLSLPFLPLSIKVDAKKPTAKEAEKVNKDSPKFKPKFSEVSGNVNLGIKGISEQDEDAPKHLLDDEKIMKSELQKRSSRPIRSSFDSSTRMGDKRHTSEAFFDPSKSDVELPPNVNSNSGVEGRILGDLLFSESTFDKYFRRLLKDHGKWLLDSNISPPKRIIESIRDVTRDQFTAATSSRNKLKEKSGMSHSSKIKPSHTQSLHEHRQPESCENDATARILLAFTPEGLPLKLKIDPCVKKPLKFLHKILSDERVSLNIPVDVINGVKPVGNGVVKLGFEDKEMSSRTPLLDLTDIDQLNYLLRTLKKTRHAHH